MVRLKVYKVPVVYYVPLVPSMAVMSPPADMQSTPSKGNKAVPVNVPARKLYT